MSDTAAETMETDCANSFGNVTVLKTNSSEEENSDSIGCSKQFEGAVTTLKVAAHHLLLFNGELW